MATPPIYEIGMYWSSTMDDDNDVQINVYVSDKHFQIDLYKAHFESNPKLLDEYLYHVTNQEENDAAWDKYLEGTTYSEPIEKFCEWATKPFLPKFRQIAPLEKRAYTLQDCLFPEKFRFTLHVEGDEIVPVPLHSTSGDRPASTALPQSTEDDRSVFPVYFPKEINIPLNGNATSLPTEPRKVFYKGNAAFFKKIWPGEVSSTASELSAYVKIYVAHFGEDVRISRLMGSVQDEKSGRILGLLLSYIDCENATMACARHEDVALREKWMKQITHTIHKLHANGIVWGDAKPENVLIDKNNDAYVVDFGGGFTEGWVEREMGNCMEGDLQALWRMARFLFETER